jgi:hypothetical protein
VCGYETFLQLWKEWRWKLKIRRGCHETDKWYVSNRTNKHEIIVFTAEGKLFLAKHKPDSLLSSAQSFCHCAHFIVMSDSALFSARVANCVYFWYSTLISAISLTLYSSAQYLCRFTRKFTSDFSHQHSFQISCSILSLELGWSTAEAELATDVVWADVSVPI